MARARATHLSLGRLQLQLVLYVFLQPSVPELLDPVLCVIYSWYIVKTVGRSDRPIWICTSRVLCNPWTRASVWGNLYGGVDWNSVADTKRAPTGNWAPGQCMGIMERNGNQVRSPVLPAAGQPCSCLPLPQSSSHLAAAFRGRRQCR